MFKYYQERIGGSTQNNTYNFVWYVAYLVVTIHEW